MHAGVVESRLKILETTWDMNMKFSPDFKPNNEARIQKQSLIWIYLVKLQVRNVENDQIALFLQMLLLGLTSSQNFTTSILISDINFISLCKKLPFIRTIFCVIDCLLSEQCMECPMMSWYLHLKTAQISSLLNQ